MGKKDTMAISLPIPNVEPFPSFLRVMVHWTGFLIMRIFDLTSLLFKERQRYTVN